ncbi:MAG: hypothetical protein NTW21_32915 [Verrucomicrobia bacterium]|nr:hypothetical protein [Verrucomicrobiota bacterium]
MDDAAPAIYSSDGSDPDWPEGVAYGVSSNGTVVGSSYQTDITP